MTDTPQLLLAHHLKALRLQPFCASMTKSPANVQLKGSIILAIFCASLNWD